MHDGRRTDLDVRTVDLGTGHLTADSALADLTGTDLCELTCVQRKVLAEYIATGSPSRPPPSWPRRSGSSTRPLPVLPPDDPVYTANGPLGPVGYRTFARQTLGHLDAPRLRGGILGNRVAILLSDEDLAVGLVGYAPSTAAAIAEHVVTYSTR